MLTIEDILNQHRISRKRPSEEELRKLPDRRALVYARPSSPHQVQESRESMREIGALVDLARADGYHTGIERAGIDAWVEEIRAGAAEPGVQEDGSLVVVTLDLGISGTLGHERRRGLALVIEVRASHLRLERPRPSQTEVYWQIVHDSNDSNAEALEIQRERSGSWNVWSLRHH